MVWLIGGLIVLIGLGAAAAYAALSVAADCDERAQAWEERAKDEERRRIA